MQFQERHHASLGRRRFFKLLFVLLFGVLTQKLWLGAIGMGDPPAVGGLDVEWISLNQTARICVGLESIVERAGIQSELVEDQLRQSALGTEKVVISRRGLWMQFILYRHLGIKPERNSISEDLEGPADETAPGILTPGAAGEEPLEPLHADIDGILRRAFFEGAEVSSEEADLLVRELGFVGKLVPRGPSPLIGDSPPARLPPEVKSEAVRFLASFAAIGFTALTLFLVGSVLLLIFLLALVKGRMVWSFDGDTREAYPLFETFTVFLAVLVTLGLLGSYLPRTPSAPILTSLVAEVGMLSLIAYPLLHGMDWAGIRDAFGLERGKGMLVEIAVGLGGYAAGIPLLALGLVASTLVARLAGQDVTSGGHPIVTDVISGESGLLNLTAIVLLAVVAAPLLEEIMFRGAFYRVLRSYLGRVPAILLSGFLFAAIHPQGWIGVPVLMAVGIVLATLREWRSSIVAPVVAHACVNGATMTVTILLLR